MANQENWGRMIRELEEALREAERVRGYVDGQLRERRMYPAGSIDRGSPDRERADADVVEGQAMGSQWPGIDRSSGPHSSGGA